MRHGEFIVRCMFCRKRMGWTDDPEDQQDVCDQCSDDEGMY